MVPEPPPSFGLCFRLIQTVSWLYFCDVRLRTAILMIVALIVVGSLAWEFRGIKFYSARIGHKN
jgi:hypothetical protein